MDLTIIARSSDSPPADQCPSTSCPSSATSSSDIPEHIQKKIENHPCYSEQAHQKFARMHLAVAPACNIQCNYCNRKYDCSNESRPGVVSEILTPAQGLKKVKAVAAEIPQLSVLGIAGPGDALANAKRTFETFRLLTEQQPELKLCLSTNGLMLPSLIDELCEFNIDHVTITINCLDPAIGAKIYPWIYWNHRRIRGEKAAKILIAQQLKGLSLLSERGVLVKVNTVLIPGINDQHLGELSQEIKKRGAFLHNLMPLIAEKEHGSYFGVMGHASPTAAELEQAQATCGMDMKLMRHCRQCRADAVGMLDEDRGAEFSLAKLEQQEQQHISTEATYKATPERHTANQNHTSLTSSAPLIAVASKGSHLVDQHFGHAKEFLIYRAGPQSVNFVGRRSIEAYCSGTEHCDEREQLLEQAIQSLEGCAAVLCAKIGFGPWQKLEAAGIKPSSDFAMDTIDEALMAMSRQLEDAVQAEPTHQLA
ncbi:nitrogenase cofactor biosynthesis protein NifB [Agaribacterium sp. ZY112]|uniref:nitrogenase cofactor biosynthesis protein NifB n=1 Tax=Agaribacterium sp. ZY112 TaxID=3233574 RepID=UPI0035259D94